MIAYRLPAVLVLGSTLAFAACGGEGLTLPPEGQPAHIAVVGGNGQSGRVGSTLAAPLVVEVTDTRDRPVEGANVVFTFTDAGGSATPGSATTNAEGRASTNLVLGTREGAVTGSAEVPVDAGTTPIETTFTATALPDNANGITLVSGNDQSGPVGSTLGAPLVVQVSDGFGNPISGVPINWSVTGGGSVSETSNQTGANGQASVTRTLGPVAGQQTTLATANDLAGSPVTFTHIATAGTATGVVKISGDGQSALAGTELALPLVVQVLDAQSNPIPNRPVTWVPAAGDGSVNPENTLTDAQGHASTRWTLGPAAGLNTLNAVVSGLEPANFTATGTAGSPSASTSDVSASPTTIPAGGNSTITVTVRDASNNPVAGASVTVTSTGSGNTIAPEVVSAGSDGMARFTFSSTVAESKMITATAGGVTITDQATITVQKVASALEITSDEPDPSAVNQPVTVEFTVSGSGGPPTGDVTVTVSGGPETCTGTLSGGSGSCVIPLQVVGAGRVITATYAGDARFSGDTDTESHTVQKVGSTVEITSDEPDPSTVNEQVTVEFTVTGSGGTPTGMVTITVSGGPETCNESLTSGSGSCTLTLLVPGTGLNNRRVLTASYSGDDRFAPDTDTENHRVNPLPTNNPPNAAFTAPSCTVGQPCQFNDASTDSDGSIETRSWEFQDGSPSTSTERNPQITFTSSGTKTVKLTVTDDGGGTDEVTHDVTVSEPANNPPNAAFTPPSCTSGQPCQFTDGSSDSDGNIASWNWNFGDDIGTSPDEDPIYTYGTAGDYQVTLTVTDDDGATDAVTQDVTVN